MIWQMISMAALVCLILTFQGGRSAVLGGFAVGCVLGLAAAAIYSFLGEGFHWFTVWKWAACATLLSAVLNAIGRSRTPK